MKSRGYLHLHGLRIGSTRSRLDKVLLTLTHHFLAGTYCKTLILSQLESGENQLLKKQSSPTL